MYLVKNMSFTSDIKKEMVSYSADDTEIIAELSGAFNISGVFENGCISIVNENENVIKRLYNLIVNKYHVNVIFEKDIYNSLRKKMLTRMIINEKVDLILEDLCLYDKNLRKFIPYEYIVDTDKEKQAYLRGVFLLCGSINDPKTSRYSLGFVIINKDTADFVCKLLNDLGFNAKVLKRSKNYMVYVKESEQISDFIKMLPAMNSLFYYEDIRIYRDLQNMVNRINNCEQANADKVINASFEQLEMIKLLKERVDFDLLDEGIKDVCVYREKYPDVSTRELAEIISYETDKSISKSGINHRFRKIKKILENN